MYSWLQKDVYTLVLCYNISSSESSIQIVSYYDKVGTKVYIFLQSTLPRNLERRMENQ